MSYLELAKKIQAGLKSVPESAPATDPTEGRIIAVCICSKILQAHIWLTFDEGFDPGDGLPVFYPDELQFLKEKPAATLRKIYESKVAFGPGTRVRQ